MKERSTKDEDIYKARIFRVSKSGMISEEKEGDNKENRAAWIVLPDGTELAVDTHRIFGREDFQCCLTKTKYLLISRNHFLVYRQGFRFFIEDGAAGKSSTNGTKINGREIKGKGRVILRNGMEIQIANTIKVAVKIERL